MVYPQATDVATAEISYSVLTLAISFLVYLMYQLYKDLMGEWPSINETRQQRRTRDVFRKSSASAVSDAAVSPQSDEIPKDTGLEKTTVENVTFSDKDAGHMVNWEGAIDELRDAALNDDATLDQFFSRPVKIFEQEWGVGTSLFFKINPWTLYFTNTRVINRISNYKLMRADLHLKILVNVNQFHYGRAIAS
jgi:hypothetical protein